LFSLIFAAEKAATREAVKSASPTDGAVSI
jgi:hypothetical protein